MAAAGASSESVYCVVPRIAVAVEEEEEEAVMHFFIFAKAKPRRKLKS